MDILNRKLILVAVICMVAGLCTTCGAPLAALAGGTVNAVIGTYILGILLVLLAIGLAMLIAVRWAWNFANKKEEETIKDAHLRNRRH